MIYEIKEYNETEAEVQLVPFNLNVKEQITITKKQLSLLMAIDSFHKRKEDLINIINTQKDVFNFRSYRISRIGTINMSINRLYNKLLKDLKG